MEETILKDYIVKKYQLETSGHNAHHILKVVENTRYLSEKEGLSLKEQQQALCLAYLHEELDHKLVSDEQSAIAALTAQLLQWQVEKDQVSLWLTRIKAISFSKKTKENAVPLFVKVVQDADLLEAIGAMGIIRTITYGAVKNRPLYDETKQGIANSSTIQHFYDKLLKIPDYLSTETGKAVGKKRMVIIHDFLGAFHQEWEGLK